MTTPAHIIPAVKALMAGYPEAHVARVIDAIKKGPRISLPELAKLKGVGLRCVWRWIEIGKIPRPRKDGRRTNTWDYSEVAHIL